MFKLLGALAGIFLSLNSSATLEKYEVLQLKDDCRIKEIQNGNSSEMTVREIRGYTRDLGDFSEAKNPSKYFLEVFYKNINNIDLSKKVFVSSRDHAESLIEKLNNKTPKKDEKGSDLKKRFILLAAPNCDKKIVTLVDYNDPSSSRYELSELNKKTDFTTLSFDENGDLIPLSGPGEALIENPTFPGTNLPFFQLQQLSEYSITRNAPNYNVNATLEQICLLHGYNAYKTRTIKWEVVDQRQFGVVYDVNINNLREEHLQPETIISTTPEKVEKRKSTNRKIVPFKFANKKVKSIVCWIRERSLEIKEPFLAERVTGEIEIQESSSFFGLKKEEVGVVYHPIMMSYEGEERKYPLILQSNPTAVCREFGYDYGFLNSIFHNSEKLVYGIKIDSNGTPSIEEGNAATDVFCYSRNE